MELPSVPDIFLLSFRPKINDFCHFDQREKSGNYQSLKISPSGRNDKKINNFFYFKQKSMTFVISTSGRNLGVAKDSSSARAKYMMLEKGWQLVADYILNWLSEQNL